MSLTPDDTLHSAGIYPKKLALAATEVSSKRAKNYAQDDAARKALIESPTKCSEISDEEAIQCPVTVIGNTTRTEDRGAVFRETRKKDGRAGKMKRKVYEKELRKLQVKLCRVQSWVKERGLRVIILFEGRDAAGKGGTIKALTARVSPRVFRVVALPAPTDREKTQIYMQRYIERFPAAGEVVIFDRSWYNRAGVERVMRFCTKEEHQNFLKICPEFEKYILDGGITLIKVWLEVGKEEQERRFLARIEDPLRQWKLSPMDIESYDRWDDYSRARDQMLRMTDTERSPWHIVRSDDKRRARLNCISHIVSLIPHKKVRQPKVKLPKRSNKTKYDDVAGLKGRKFVIDRYRNLPAATS